MNYRTNALKFIFFSSVKACADTVEGVLTEECVPNPQTPYGRSKLEAEGVVRSALVHYCDSALVEERGKRQEDREQTTNERVNYRTNALSYYILRPAMIQGPGNKGNMNLLIKVVKAGIPWPLGAFENKRSFASIENVVRVVEALLTKDVEPGIYQVADDEPLSTNQVIEQIAASLGKKPRIWRLPRGLMRGVARLGDFLHLPLNSERLKKLTESYVVSNAKLRSVLATTKWSQRASIHMSKKRIILSLGRLHPLKGLDLLIAAWEKCGNGGGSRYGMYGGETPRQGSALVEERGKRQEGRELITNERMNYRTNEPHPWQLVIAGPDEQGMREKLKAESKKLKLSIAEVSELAEAGDADVVFMGPVHGEEKWALMKRADIFVLPSRSENFGIVVGEALSCGVPVVTTAVGPWGEGRAVARPCRGGIAGASDRSPVLREENGLLVVETSVEGIAQGLRQMMVLSDEERQELGRQGREWVKQEFSWERVAKQMVEAYGEGRAAARPY